MLKFKVLWKVKMKVTQVLPQAVYILIGKISAIRNGWRKRGEQGSGDIHNNYSHTITEKVSWESVNFLKLSRGMAKVCDEVVTGGASYMLSEYSECRSLKIKKTNSS